MPKGYKTKKVQAREAATEAYLEAEGLSAVRVLEEYRRLAFFDTRTLFDAAGNLKPMTELTQEQGAALASIEVIIKNAKAGDGVTDTVHKVRVWDKTRALEGLGKHFGLFKETLNVSGDLRIRWADQ